VNAHEGKAGRGYLQVKLCDPGLSALCVPWCKKALYKYSSFPFLLHTHPPLATGLLTMGIPRRYPMRPPLYGQKCMRAPSGGISVLLTDLLWPPYVIGQAIMFLPCGFFLLSSICLLFFYSSPNLSGRRLDVYRTSTYGVALV